MGEAAETVGEAWLDALRQYNALRCQGPRAAAACDAEVLEQLHGTRGAVRRSGALLMPLRP